MNLEQALEELHLRFQEASEEEQVEIAEQVMDVVSAYVPLVKDTTSC